MLPPLRSRREDIPALIERFWRDATTEPASGQPLPSHPLASLSANAMTALTNAYWPGNLDHLQNVVANLALGAGPGDITPDHVKRLLGEAAAPSRAVAPEITARFFDLPLREAREAFERAYFEHHLALENGSIAKVAEKSGLERTHLYRKLKALGFPTGRKDD